MGMGTRGTVVVYSFTLSWYEGFVGEGVGVLWPQRFLGLLEVGLLGSLTRVLFVGGSGRKK